MQRNSKIYTIKEALKIILEIAKFSSKYEFKKNMGYPDMYRYVKMLAPENYLRIKNPEASIRYQTQKMLSGYKRYST